MEPIVTYGLVLALSIVILFLSMTVVTAIALLKLYGSKVEAYKIMPVKDKFEIHVLHTWPFIFKEEWRPLQEEVEVDEHIVYANILFDSHKQAVQYIYQHLVIIH